MIEAYFNIRNVSTFSIAYKRICFFPLHTEPEVSIQILGRPYHKNQIELLRNLFMDLVSENPDIWTSDFKEELRSLMSEAIRLEKEFIDDCLPVSSIGLSPDEFKQYIDYIANRRLKSCGLEELTPGITNPLPWLAELMDIKKEQNFFTN